MPNPSSKDVHSHPKLIEFLVCPISKTTLTYDEEAQELISKAAKLAFPIKDGIPMMVVAEARNLDFSE